ncbi:hypothetical protein Pelo_15990 [Pelomyxa schiedti]|nr:hypothetical protein Pelo_15990 [Pelomyxa schiedti]
MTLGITHWHVHRGAEVTAMSASSSVVFSRSRHSRSRSAATTTVAAATTATAPFTVATATEIATTIAAATTIATRITFPTPINRLHRAGKRTRAEIDTENAQGQQQREDYAWGRKEINSLVNHVISLSCTTQFYRRAQNPAVHKKNRFSPNTEIVRSNSKSYAMMRYNDNSHYPLTLQRVLDARSQFIALACGATPTVAAATPPARLLSAALSVLANIEEIGQKTVSPLNSTTHFLLGVDVMWLPHDEAITLHCQERKTHNGRQLWDKVLYDTRTGESSVVFSAPEYTEVHFVPPSYVCATTAGTSRYSEIYTPSDLRTPLRKHNEFDRVLPSLGIFATSSPKSGSSLCHKYHDIATGQVLFALTSTVEAPPPVQTPVHLYFNPLPPSPSWELRGKIL